MMTIRACYLGQKRRLRCAVLSKIFIQNISRPVWPSEGSTFLPAGVPIVPFELVGWLIRIKQQQHKACTYHEPRPSVLDKMREQTLEESVDESPLLPQSVLSVRISAYKASGPVLTSAKSFPQAQTPKDISGKPRGAGLLLSRPKPKPHRPTCWLTGASSGGLRRRRC